jgi:tetratricopeptide (TPR) repeat protein
MGRRHPLKALRILLGSQSKDNHSLVAKFQCNLGIIQYKLGNSKKALKMAEKALSDSSVCSSEDEKDTAYIYDLFSKVYEKDGGISKALEYSQKAIEKAKISAIRNRTFEIEYFLYRLDNLKRKASVGDNQNSMSVTGTKFWLDHVNIQDDILPKLEELQQALESNIKQSLKLLGMLISMYSRQKNQFMAMKYFDQAQTIYSEHQTSDLITKEQLEYAMAIVFYNAASNYHIANKIGTCV